MEADASFTVLCAMMPETVPFGPPKGDIAQPWNAEFGSPDYPGWLDDDRDPSVALRFGSTLIH
jgi:hypothetical protein